MCSPLFNYTWTLDVGHDIPATISVRGTSPETARQTVVHHISGLDKSLASIDTRDTTDPRALDAAATLRSDISRKLRISAAAAVGIPMNSFRDQISATHIAFALDKLLQTVVPAVEPSEQPRFAWDREPTFTHYIPTKSFL